MKHEDAQTVVRRRLAELKQDRGQLAALAKELKVRPASVTEWLQGKYNPPLDKLGGIASFFKMSLAEFFGAALPEGAVSDLPTTLAPGISVVPTAPPARKSFYGATSRQAREHYYREALAAAADILETQARVIRAELEAASETHRTRRKRPPRRRDG